jgi:hypothetical protein
LQFDYKVERECCRGAFFDAFEYRRETPAQCQRLVRIHLALTDLEWKAALRSTKMCLWENRELGQAVRHSLTVEPETALHSWLAAWR